jgi:hypothetical protein
MTMLVFELFDLVPKDLTVGVTEGHNLHAVQTLEMIDVAATSAANARYRDADFTIGPSCTRQKAGVRR